MTHEELKACIEDQDRRLGEALKALNEMRGSVPEELVAEVAREFERISELTPQVSQTSSQPTMGLRA
jgi:hypothetical protein